MFFSFNKGYTIYLVMYPIYGGGQRQGTLLLARYDVEFEDLILGEYGATEGLLVASKIADQVKVKRFIKTVISKYDSFLV